MTTKDQAIPLFYKAVGLGPMFSNLYQNGNYFTEAIKSGKAVRNNAVNLNNWE